MFGAAAFGLGGWRLFAAPPGWKPHGNPNIVFGVLADTHLRISRSGGYDGRNWPDKYLVAALEHFRAQNVDAVVHCGDMADRGVIAEMQFHADAWRKVFPDGCAADGRKVHEPNGGVTTLEIPKSELPPGKTLAFAVRPLTSLGTSGKAIATEFKV